MSDLVLGIDEAGRGPILGPMVMACVALQPRQAARLTRAGVVDSKRYGAGEKAHAERSALLPKILEAAAHVEIVVVEVKEIDQRTRRGELNRLEQERAAILIDRAPPARRIVADGQKLFQPLRQQHLHLDALDHGEEQHVAVAAASLVAKVRRDELFLRIAQRYNHEYGPVRGGGYMNDATRVFLRAYIERHRRPPPEGRRSWPWEFARDLLGDDYDPAAEILVPQLELF